MKPARRLSENRDIAILKFLWRWKVSTTSALSFKFFSNCSAKTAYYRLKELEAGQFIQIRCNPDGQKFVWVLGSNGYRCLKERLPQLKVPGYGSQSINHDLIASAIHNGDWFLDVPQNVEIVTEQELRRFLPELLPPWVPKTTTRIPDGYWNVPRGDRLATIALEVELIQKDKDRYQRIGKFYSNNNFIYRVLWIVPRSSLATHISKIIQEAYPTKPNIHNFVIFSDFQKFGWQALIQVGPEQKQTIAQLLGSTSSALGQPAPSRHLLDVRKCPYKSKRWLEFSPTSFSDIA
jgi:hypothetical protein